MAGGVLLLDFELLSIIRDGMSGQLVFLQLSIQASVIPLSSLSFHYA